MTVRNSRLTFNSIGCAVVVLAMAFAARSGWAIACQDFDTQCMGSGVCQADGTCQGTPINEGQPCTDRNIITAPCTLTATCQSGTCVAVTTLNDNDPCTPPPELGKCVKNTVCQVVPPFPPFTTGGTYCTALSDTDVVDCETLGQKCMVCNPQTGECTVSKCSGPCDTGQCDSATGNCEAKPNGTTCNDFNVCTSNDQCESGDCKGSTTGPTPTPTALIPPISSCTGDCNNVRAVTVDNVLTMIYVGVGKLPVTACMAGDRNHDSKITVDEDLTAIGNALEGCPALPTPTPTATTKPVSPTPTATTGTQPTAGPGSSVSGQTSVAIGAVSVIGDVVAAIASGYQLGTASLLITSSSLMTPADPGFGQAAAACPGGSGTVTKSGNPLTGTMNVTFSNDCTLPTYDGTVAFNGTASVGLATGINVNITGDYRNTSGTLLEHVAATVQGSLQGFTPSFATCFLTQVKLGLTGTLSTTVNPPSGPTASVTFPNTTPNTTLDVRNISFNTACVPTAFDLILTGPGALLATGGSPVSVTFGGLTLHINSSSNPTTMTVSGNMTAPCFGGGGSTTLATTTTLTIPSHQNCPTAGVITSSLGTTTITFGAGGSVHIQSPTENLTAPNCYDPRLLACVA